MLPDSSWKSCICMSLCFSTRMQTPHPTKGLANRRKTPGHPMTSSSADVVLNVPTQLLAGCLSNTDGSWPFSSSLQTTWPLRCFWLCIIHWWCPSHESLRLCIQTLTRLTAQRQTYRAAEQAGWMEMPTSDHALTGGLVFTITRLQTSTFPYSSVFSSWQLETD